MTTRDLFEAIGAMDDDLILEADRPPEQNRRNWRPVLVRAVPAAACVCLIAGAVLWQLQGGQAGGAALPETAAAALPDEAAQAAPGTGSDTAQTREYDSVTSLYNGPEASQSAFPAGLADLLEKGSGPYLSDTVSQTTDRAESSDGVLPDRVSVFRSMAAARTVDTSGMYGRMRSMLSALNLDTALADGAVYTGLTQDEAEEQAALLRQNGGSEGEELQLWADAGTLTLEVASCDGWLTGLTLTADNTGTVTAQAPDAEPTGSSAESTARLIQTSWPGIAGLAGPNPVFQSATGTEVRFYSQSDTVTGVIEAGELNSVSAVAAEDGTLCRVVWHNADLTHVEGEYTPLTRAEAEDQLRQGMFLTDGGSLDGESVLENLVDVRLYYPESRDCAWYLPYWCFTADEGPSEDGSTRIYCEYLVPALSLQDLTDLAETG